MGTPRRQNGRLRDGLRLLKEKIELLTEVRWPSQGVLQLDGTAAIHSGMAAGEAQNQRRGVVVILGESVASAWSWLLSLCLREEIS